MFTSAQAAPCGSSFIAPSTDDNESCASHAEDFLLKEMRRASSPKKILNRSDFLSWFHRTDMPASC
jgi:hypothetical protein